MYSTVCQKSMRTLKSNQDIKRAVPLEIHKNPMNCPEKKAAADALICSCFHERRESSWWKQM